MRLQEEMSPETGNILTVQLLPSGPGISQQ